MVNLSKSYLKGKPSLDKYDVQCPLMNFSSCFVTSYCYGQEEEVDHL